MRREPMPFADPSRRAFLPDALTRRVAGLGALALAGLAALVWRERTRGRERAEARRAAARSQELEALYQNAPMGMGVVDVRGRYVRVNRVLAGYLGVSPADAIGRTMLELVPKDAPAAQPYFEKVLRERVPVVDFELPGASPAEPDVPRTWRVSFYPLLDERGRVAAVGGIIYDVTALHRAHDALREADRRKDAFLATLAHELRGPLAPIRTGLKVLERAPQGGEAMHATLEMMNRQLAHTLRLVDDLLDISRIGRGKMAIRRDRVPVRAIVESALEASRSRIEAGRHRLRVDLPVEPLHVLGDADRLVQALQNLLGNAAKYTPNEGDIVLGVRRDRHRVVLEVRDTGVGIDPEFLPRVFTPYSQHGATIDRSQGGLGIGLSLVKAIVELHGGTVDARSAGPGRGSTFTVVLPAATMRDTDYGRPG
jgi:PAS domain S-box-containing protein